MGAYLQLYPDVVGELQLSDGMANLVEDGIDLAVVCIGNLPDSSLIVRHLGETRRVVVASPAYIARHGEPKDPGELGSHKIIQFTDFEPPARPIQLAYPAARLLPAKVRALVDLAAATVDWRFTDFEAAGAPRRAAATAPRKARARPPSAAPASRR
jgi:DNA-binding transcriptional LysR family regulator